MNYPAAVNVDWEDKEWKAHRKYDGTSYAVIGRVFTNALMIKDTLVEEEKNFQMEQLSAVSPIQLQDIGFVRFQSP